MSQDSRQDTWLRDRAVLATAVQRCRAGHADTLTKRTLPVLLDGSAASWRALDLACDQADRAQQPLLPILVRRRTWLDSVCAGSLPAGPAAVAAAFHDIRLELEIALTVRGIDGPILAPSAPVALDVLTNEGASVVIASAALARSIGRRAARRGVTVIAVP